MKRCLILLVIVVIIFDISKVQAEDWASARERVGKVFDDAASKQGINLSIAERNALAKDILVTAKYNKIAPDSITILPIEAEKLTKAIKEWEKSISSIKSADDFIIQNKIAKVTAKISDDISMSAKKTDVVFSGNVEEIIQNDLKSRTKIMAESGLTVEEIQDRNREYLAMIFHSLPTEVGFSYLSSITKEGADSSTVFTTGEGASSSTEFTIGERIPSKGKGVYSSTALTTGEGAPSIEKGVHSSTALATGEGTPSTGKGASSYALATVKGTYLPSSHIMTTEIYTILKNGPFESFVTLIITSTPLGANVAISNSFIGTTPIEKVFESGKKYTFIFSLQGREISRRDYYVDPYKKIQKLDEILIK